MKSSIINTRSVFMLMALGLITFTSAFAGTGNHKSNPMGKEVASVAAVANLQFTFEEDAELAAFGHEELAFMPMEFTNTSVHHAEVFDAAGTLIAEGDLDEFGFATCGYLQDTLNKATRIMSYEGVDYYQMN